MERRNWIDIELGKHSLSEYEVSKKVFIFFVIHRKYIEKDDGAVLFWRIKENLQNPFSQSIHWSNSRWKACLAAGGGGNKKRFQYCIDDSGTIVYFRALQGDSGRSLTDPTLQDNVVIPSNSFQYIYHVGCAFNLHSIINSGLTLIGCAINLHSIINSGLIFGGQKLDNRQTVFFLLVDPKDKKS